MMFNSVYLGLGSNRDNRLWYIVQALRLLDKSPNIEIRRISGIYDTKPYGIKNQRDFLNSVVEIHTNFRPAKLLQFGKFIEIKLGRIDRGKWQPREIDIDILTYSDLQLSLSWLNIPHKDLHKRRFVLAPFCEISPDLWLPGYQKKIQNLYDFCPDQGKVRLIYPAEELHIKLGAREKALR